LSSQVGVLVSLRVFELEGVWSELHALHSQRSNLDGWAKNKKEASTKGQLYYVLISCRQGPEIPMQIEIGLTEELVERHELWP